MKKVELISPAGNVEKAEVAFIYGADGIYLGGKKFNLRAHAGNLSLEEINYILNIAKKLKKNVYITINVYFRNYEFDELKNYLGKLLEIGLKKLIISDAGVIYFINKFFKNKFHLILSTQANITNFYSAEFFKELGIKRIILARELTLDEIREIKKQVNIEIETFIHGAMCVSYSGRCLLSEYFTGRNANRGDCAQPCRWEYYLIEKKRNEPLLQIEEDKRGTYLLSSKDLCMIEHIHELIDAGIDAFKIEGRMKSIYYVANTTRVYRDAIDSYYKKSKSKLEIWKKELDSVSHRPYFKGFYWGYDENTVTFKRNYKRDFKFIGYILRKVKNNIYEVKFKNPLNIEQNIEIILPNMKNLKNIKFNILDENFIPVYEAQIHGKFFLQIELNLAKYSIIKSSGNSDKIKK